MQTKEKNKLPSQLEDNTLVKGIYKHIIFSIDNDMPKISTAISLWSGKLLDEPVWKKILMKNMAMI